MGKIEIHKPLDYLIFNNNAGNIFWNSANGISLRNIV